MTLNEMYIEQYGGEAYDILCDYVEDGELFNPSDWPDDDFDWDIFVELVPQSMPVREYFTPDEIARIFTLVQHDEYGFPMSSRFGVDEYGRVYEEKSPDYKVLGWTPEMQKWIDENID